ncbi:alpha-methylacyl-CoA racemase-like [Oscarella lobularis]|uniref:alpha-methylacyl-CoA racemase-like n=1 Tax=Oscarella lobularis TaxID=121494 RepID=UPI0033142BA2
MALRGVRVLELAGLAPAPFAGMILADFGASVIRVDKVQRHTIDTLARGKKSICLNLNDPRSSALFKRLCITGDVLIEPYRAGVMEKLGLGPDVLMASNPRLIYARLTGYGQKGPMAHMAGHDINYLSLSGILSMLGRKGENPIPPINLLADFSGGSLICVIGILMALLRRTETGKGQIIDANMVNGASYIGTFLHSSRKFWTGPRGTNLLDSGAPFYETYATSDGEYMAVGAIEPAFYRNLLKGLGFEESLADNQFDQSGWEKLKEAFSRTFAGKTQSEWVAVFKDLDACVTPVLSLDEAAQHPHNRHSYIPTQDGTLAPAPAPRLSESPAVPSDCQSLLGGHTEEILSEIGVSKEELKRLVKEKVVGIPIVSPQSSL